MQKDSKVKKLIKINKNCCFNLYDNYNRINLIINYIFQLPVKEKKKKKNNF